MDRKKAYYEVITDAWNLLKDHMDGADFEKEYQQIKDLEQKYKDKPEFDFAKDIIVSVMTEINRLYGGVVNG